MTTEVKKLFEELAASVDNYFNTMNEGLIKVKTFLDKIEQDAATTKKAREAIATELEEETNCAMEIAGLASSRQMQHSKLLEIPET
jgi:hypothetical protein